MTPPVGGQARHALWVACWERLVAKVLAEQGEPLAGGQQPGEGSDGEWVEEIEGSAATPAVRVPSTPTLAGVTETTATAP